MLSITAKTVCWVLVEEALKDIEELEISLSLKIIK